MEPIMEAGIEPTIHIMTAGILIQEITHVTTGHIERPDKTPNLTPSNRPQARKR